MWLVITALISFDDRQRDSEARPHSVRVFCSSWPRPHAANLALERTRARMGHHGGRVLGNLYSLRGPGVIGISCLGLWTNRRCKIPCGTIKQSRGRTWTVRSVGSWSTTEIAPEVRYISSSPSGCTSPSCGGGRAKNATPTFNPYMQRDGPAPMGSAVTPSSLGGNILEQQAARRLLAQRPGLTRPRVRGAIVS
jgi:hypothetical protein